jgi:antitoxin component YwqK of YwqJK toxin-antitoxin module
MRLLFLILLFVSLNGYSQWKSFVIGAKGDTLNGVDKNNLKQGRWVNHFDDLRGEPGYEEEGEYKNGRKEGVWRQYSLQGDLTGVENYKWGNKDSINQYFSPSGSLIREEGWKALNPDKQYDTLDIEDVDHLDHYKTVIVKNEGVAVKHGTWKYYDPVTGMITKTVTYSVGRLELPKPGNTNLAANDTTKSSIKPKEVLDYEKKNSGKKKIKVQDGSVSY